MHTGWERMIKLLTSYIIIMLSLHHFISNPPLRDLVWVFAIMKPAEML
jgi:hypothetical protein